VEFQILAIRNFELQTEHGSGTASLQLEVAICPGGAILMAVAESAIPQTPTLSHPVCSRREARTEAILRAALEELAQVGYSAMSIEEVAARVGVAKTTVYRRYPTKLDLVRAAIRQFLTEALGELPDAGSLRGDLIALGRSVVQLASSVIGQSLFRTRFLERLEPELDQMGKDFERDREKRQGVIATRALARGELHNLADFGTVLQLLSGSLIFKAVIKKEPVDELEITRIVDVLLQGVSPAPARHRAGTRS
jgi:AcrR family transcriptional regulator